MTPAQIERLDRILDGDVGTPVAGTDFALVLDALRETRADLARVNADFDLTASCAARVATERDALKARLDAIAAGHREPVRVEPANARHRGPVAAVLRALDGVTKNRIGSGVGVIDALRSAAACEGIKVDALSDDELVAACRTHVAVDVLGLSAASAEAVRSAP